MWSTNKSSTTFEYPPTSAVPTYPAVHRVEEPEGWCKRNYKNKPQSNSVGAAALIFLAGGMFLIGPNNATFTITKLVRMSWFIGGIIGAIIGAIACNKIEKKLITCFSSLMVSVSGILLIADSNSIDSNVSARFINGCAVGLVFPLTLVLAGEEVVKSMRGMNAASIDAMCFSLGMFLQIIYSDVWPNEAENSFSATQMMGCFCVLWGFMNFIIAFILQIESPLFYLSRGQEELAIDTLRRLQRPFTITYETYEQLDELKHYITESKEHTFIESAIMGWPALLKLCFYRSFMALSFSFNTNLALSYAVTVSMTYTTWSYYIYGFLRWIGTFVVVFTLDTKGRKPPMVIGFFVCSCLAFAIGGIFNDKRNLLDADYMTAVVYVLLAYQFFAGISMASSSAYLSEAFPLAVKPYFIALTFIAEMLVHIIIIACSAEVNVFWKEILSISKYFFAVGGFSLMFFIVALIAMPETKMNTLRECLTKFRKPFHYRS